MKRPSTSPTRTAPIGPRKTEYRKVSAPREAALMPQHPTFSGRLQYPHHLGFALKPSGEHWTDWPVNLPGW